MLLEYAEFVNEITFILMLLVQHENIINLRSWEVLCNPKPVGKIDFYLVEIAGYLS